VAFLLNKTISCGKGGGEKSKGAAQSKGGRREELRTFVLKSQPKLRIHRKSTSLVSNNFRKGKRN